MKRRTVIGLLLTMTLLASCGNTGNGRGSISEAEKPDPTETPSEAALPQTPDELPTQAEPAVSGTTVVTKGRPTLLGEAFDSYYDSSLVPSVPAYYVEDDFSNVVYEDSFQYMFYEDGKLNEVAKGLIRDNFVIYPTSSNNEFFDVYEGNRYMRFPNFITVDSLMHTYHLYFASLMRHTEEDYLAPALANMSKVLLTNAAEQYVMAKGTDWETAAAKNLELFYVGAKLQDPGTIFPVNMPNVEEIEADAEIELSRIAAADGIETSTINGEFEDYTQYIVRGYYAGNEQLEQYFRAMMWYGRTAFTVKSEDLTKSAILQTISLSEGGDGDWRSIYDITSFFAGASDDPGYYELSQMVSDAYGSMPDTEAAIADADGFARTWEALKAYQMPGINSIPVYDGDDPVIPSYRFMGQRFTIDAAIMQKLIYSAVDKNDSGECRMLPNALDTAAVLGSKEAYEILEGSEDLTYKNFSENFNDLKQRFDNDDPALWNASLYAGWLNTLRPLLEVKGEGYPSYMCSENWVRKDLETFAGSYAELKHDTVLYAKQVIAEMGGADEPEYDDRGYVDPEIEVYNRFVNLAEKTEEGLKGYGMLSKSAEEDLERLKEIALKLVTISEKELKNELLSDEEYDFIREYGGNLEHFWKEANQDTVDYSLNYSYQSPCPVITDIATDPNGQVLEIGSGQAQKIYVVFPIDGELHVGSGSAYSFYQFTQPMSQRMTDQEWRGMLDGGYLDDDWNWIKVESDVEQPAWTSTYRTAE